MAGNSEKTGKKPRGPGKKFAPGESGNPSGRPPRTAEELDLIVACKNKTPSALAIVEKLMYEASSDKTKLSAALAIIERAYGKAEQPVKADVQGNIVVNIKQY